MKVDLPFVAALLRVTMGSATLTTGPGGMVRRVRKRMKTKEGFWGERGGINTKVAEITENTEQAQGRADPPRRADGIGRGRWRGIIPEDSSKKLLCQTIT